VHVIRRKKLLAAVTQHRDLAVPFDVWYRVAKKADWRSLEDVRKTFPSADAVGKYTVFNIKGDVYRLIIEINYRTARLFVRHVLTRAKYDKGGWQQ
jgi:mRNA interferase HigB